MFTLTLQREKRKKISEVFRRLPKLLKSSEDFAMLAQRIRNVFKVHQITVLKANRFLIYWLTENQLDSL